MARNVFYNCYRATLMARDAKSFGWLFFGDQPTWVRNLNPFFRTHRPWVRKEIVPTATFLITDRSGRSREDNYPMSFGPYDTDYGYGFYM